MNTLQQLIEAGALAESLSDESMHLIVEIKPHFVLLTDGIRALHRNLSGQAVAA